MMGTKNKKTKKQPKKKMEGTYVYLWLIHDVWQKPTQYVKQLSFNQNKF